MRIELKTMERRMSSGGDGGESFIVSVGESTAVQNKEVHMKVSRWLILIVVLLFTLTACSGNAPAKAAKEWLTAASIGDGATTLKLTCQQYQTDVQTMSLLTAGVGMLGGMAGIDTQSAEVDLSDIEFETVSKNGGTAVVRVEGQMITSLMGAAMPQPLNMSFKMVKEDGEWKWCGE